MTFITGNTAFIARTIFDETVDNYKEEIRKRDTQIAYLQEEVHKYENNQAIAEEVASALSSAIEKGDYLHIGIVLGQSIQRLHEIVYK